MDVSPPPNVCEHIAHLIWANVAGALVTNTGTLIWAGMLIHALCW